MLSGGRSRSQIQISKFDLKKDGGHGMFSPMMRRRAVSISDEPQPGTREQLLEAAGHVFAEKGFDRATGKEICARAGTNAAAVNYYFGGIDRLYAAVLRAAHREIVTVERLRALVADEPDPRSQLEAIISTIVHAVTGPAGSSWMLRVIGRELVAPSPVFVEMRDKEIFPKLGILKSVVAKMIGLPATHPAVERGCLSIIAPCILLLIGDRRFFKRAFPRSGFGPDDAATLTHHMVEFALAGIAAIARSAKKQA
jgi:TetR/AcrR family transcriptional regulator, regulator of cefoperazone and chloramphenicol sensitivity